MTDEQPEQDSEIRRRAAWLLGMLALVAALFVALMVTFFNSSGGDSDVDQAGPDDVGLPTSSQTQSQSQSSNSSGATRSGAPSSTPKASPSNTPTGSGRGSCPSAETCALDTDIGNALAAINAYRTDNGKSEVTGSVSAQAKKCALSNGSDCSGSWAETPVPATDGKVDGKAAVAKIQQFGKLLTDMKSIEIGWAYDPGSKQYYFAIVRNI